MTDVAQPDGLTFLDLARSVGQEHGVLLTDGQATGILWEYTGFPGFWDGDPLICCTEQLHAFFDQLSPVALLKMKGTLKWMGPWRLLGGVWARTFVAEEGGVDLHFGPQVKSPRSKR